MQAINKDNLPLVSVIIPTFKRSGLLDRAIQSVLKQTYPRIELIVVDDNGPNEDRDHTVSLLENYKDLNTSIVLQLNPVNKGGSESRNIGAKKATGEYLSFLDDDDFFHPDKIEKQYLLLAVNPEYAGCLCAMRRIDNNNREILSTENFPRGQNLKEAILTGNFFTPMLLIKTSVFRMIGGFDHIPRFQDKYLQYKILEKDQLLILLNIPLYTMMEHEGDRITNSNEIKTLTALKIIHDFEIKHKKCFTINEWDIIKKRFYFNIAYYQCEGNFSSKVSALYHFLKSIRLDSPFNMNYKVLVKSILPNPLINALSHDT